MSGLSKPTFPLSSLSCRRYYDNSLQIGNAKERNEMKQVTYIISKINTLQLYFIIKVVFKFSGRRLNLLSPTKFSPPWKPFHLRLRKEVDTDRSRQAGSDGVQSVIVSATTPGDYVLGLQLVLKISGNLVPQPSLCRFHELLYEHGILVITVSSVLWLWVGGPDFLSMNVSFLDSNINIVG